MKAIQLCALCLMFLLSHLSFGQNFNQEIKKSINQFEQSLIQKNVNSLDKILHQNLTLGHSNGWIETKNSLLETLPTSQVSYEEFINIDEPEMIFVNENLVTLRRNIIAVGTYQSHHFEVNLNVLEVWINEKETWQLLCRQSVEKSSK